jgi:hypothetical protein
MTPNINLVPADCLLTHRRHRRMWAWAGIWCAAVVAVASAWWVRHTNITAAERMSAQVKGVEGQRFVLEKQLQAARDDRARLHERIRLLARLRPEQPWPERLLSLAAAAPNGVMLSHLASEPPAPAVAVAPPQTPAPGAAQPTAKPPPKTAEPILEQVVQLRGVALGYNEVTELVNALRSRDEWTRTEWISSSQQPLGHGIAIAFELRCPLRRTQP